MQTTLEVARYLAKRDSPVETREIIAAIHAMCPDTMLEVVRSRVHSALTNFRKRGHVLRTYADVEGAGPFGTRRLLKISLYVLLNREIIVEHEPQGSLQDAPGQAIWESKPLIDSNHFACLAARWELWLGNKRVFPRKYLICEDGLS